MTIEGIYIETPGTIRCLIALRWVKSRPRKYEWMMSKTGRIFAPKRKGERIVVRWWEPDLDGTHMNLMMLRLPQ